MQEKIEHALPPAAGIFMGSTAFGDYAVIVLGALLGALVALSRKEFSPEEGLFHAGRFIVLRVFVSSLFSLPVAYWLSVKFQIPFQYVLWAASGGIAMLEREHWAKLKEVALARWSK